MLAETWKANDEIRDRHDETKLKSQHVRPVLIENWRLQTDAVKLLG
ncbi:hypothetical protein Mal52_28080 [Symmachiella dynata]|uniref:Uncharacterized protein n=1 Tax=Symmachiella dynata TaxID=2527995 RepID=A0A517ZPC2_9PLAN|nr:hypothetical protein [Symmachiella dynata]QDU44329.1 hypothetical protein Mal52_28080 [Symmachiella dynata]